MLAFSTSLCSYIGNCVNKIFLSFSLWAYITGRPFCLLLEISLRVTTLLEVINFLESITHPAIFSNLDIGYLDSLASLSLLVYILNMLTCFGSFLGFLLLFSTKEKSAKDADVSGP